MQGEKITLIQRCELQEDKYRCLLDNTPNAKMYFDISYLDFTTHRKWKCLVLGDYQVVMPIPICGNFFSRICMPMGCQSLGILSNEVVSAAVVQSFYRAIKKISLFGGSYSSYDLIGDFSTQARINCVLDISKGYDFIEKNYASSLKRNLRVARENCLILKEIEPKVALDFKLQTSKHLSKKQKKILTNYIHCPIPKKGFGVFISNELVASCWIFFFKDQLYYFFPALSSKGRNLQAGAFLLDAIIQKYTQKFSILDFEGSSIPAIRLFYKKFGCEEQIYFNYNFGWICVFEWIKNVGL